MEKQFIAISGNIGVGKSTLTTMLVEKLGIHWRPFYEAVEGNPYLADFYQDMQKWSFHLQVYFLGHRARVHLDICGGNSSAIQDRSIYEDASIFARALRESGMLSERAYQAYRGVYDAMIRTLPPPDLIVYLQASVPTLLSRIATRGRDIEKNISPLYLQQLNELYDAWVADFDLCPILTIPTDGECLAGIAKRVLEYSELFQIVET